MTFRPQSKFKYFTKIEIEACQWTGHNLDEMKQLLAAIVDSNEWDGPEVYSDYIEDYFLPLTQKAGGGYNMLKFYAGDDMEVDPGQWVVVYSDGEVEIMSDEEFHKLGYRHGKVQQIEPNIVWPED
jgi:hypothetical protein